MELENIVANTVYLKAREGKYKIKNVLFTLPRKSLLLHSLLLLPFSHTYMYKPVVFIGLCVDTGIVPKSLTSL